MMDKRLKNWIIFALVSLLLVPPLVYMGGSVLVGPYEGEFGMIGMIGTIYADAARLKASAWIVLLAPLLLGLIWAGCIRLSNILQERYSSQ